MFRVKADVSLSFTHVDLGSRDVCGYAPAELIETGHITLLDLIHAEERDMVRRTIQAALDEKRSFGISIRLQVKDRSFVEGILIGNGVFLSPLSLTGIEGYIIRLLHQPLCDNSTGLLSPEAYQQLLSHTEEVIALLTHEGQILYVTPSISRIMGYEQNAVIGLMFTNVLPSYEHTRFLEFKTQMLAGGGSSARFHIMLPDGQVRTLLLRLFKPGGMSGVILTATKSEEPMDLPPSGLYHDLFARNPIPTIITTSSDLRIQEMNQAALAYASSYAPIGQAGADLRETGLISREVIEQAREGLSIADHVDIADIWSGWQPVRIIAREIQSGDRDLIIWTINPKVAPEELQISDTIPESRQARHTSITLLQLVRSILSQKHRSSGHEPEHDMRYAKMLLQALVQLYESGGGKGSGVPICTYIRLIIGCITEDFAEEMQDIEIVVSCVIEDSISEKHAALLGIITGEVVMNAIRHAFTPGQPGRIDLSLQREEGWYIYQVQDSGRGLPESVIKAGGATSGFSIIEKLAMELSGTMTLANDGGAVIRIIFPAQILHGT